MAEDIVLNIRPEVSRKSKDDLERGFTRAGERAGDKFEKGFKTSIGPLGVAIGATLAAGVIKAISEIGQAAKQSVQDLRDFSRGIAEINSILPANQKLTKDATNSLIAFSSQFATGPSTQAKAFYNIVSAGVKGTALQLQTLQVANKAAVAGLVNIDDSAKLLVSSVNAYAKSGLTAAQASDSLFVAVREGQTTFAELSEFLGNVTGVASAAGLQFNELTGAVAAFTKQGLSTDVAVTGIRQVLVSVIKPTKEAADEARRLGIEFSTAGLKAKGFAQFIQDIAKRTGGSSESISKLFGNVRALTPILTTVNGNFKEFERILNQTADSAGATGEAFKIIEQNLDFKLKRRTQELKNFGLVISRTFTEVFGSAVSSVIPSITTIEAAVIAVGRTVNVAFIAPFELAFNLIKTGFNTLLFTASKVINGLLHLVDVTLGDALRSLNIGSALTDGLTDAVAKSDKATAGFFKKLKDSADDTFKGTMFGKSEEFIDRLENNLLSAKEKILATNQEIRGALNGGNKEGEGGAGSVGGVFSTLFSNINKGFSEVTDRTKSEAEQQKEALKKLAKSAAQSGQRIRAGLANGIGQGFAAFGAAIAKGENALDAFVKAFLASLGQMAIQQGTFFILEGLGLQFVPGLQAQGAALIGVGGAMAALGGALTAISGGGAAAPGGGSFGGAGGVGSIQTEPVITDQAEEREEPETRVQVQINGDVFDSTETGTRIVNILNDAFDKEGVVINNASFA